MAGPRKPSAEDAVRERLEREQELGSTEAGADAPDGGSPPAVGASEDGAPAGGGSEGAEAGQHEDAEAAGALDAAADAGDGEDAQAAEPEAEAEAESEDPLVAAQRERDEYLALAQRTQADFENWRKRASKEAAAASRRAKSGLAGELLPVLDNLERALESATDGEGQLAGGVRLVHSELISVLGRNGIEPFDPGGEKFDPALHEALATRAEEGSEPGVVLDVVEKGYRLADSVLRPARVVVSA